MRKVDNSGQTGKRGGRINRIMTEIVATKVITCGRKARKYVLQGSGFGFCSNFQQGVKREVSYNKDKIQRVNQSLQYFMGLRLIPF